MHREALTIFGWDLRRINTLNVIWRLSSFTGGGRPQVPLCALLQARAGTRVEPSTFCKLDGWLCHMKESKVNGGIRTHSCEGQLILSQLI